MSILAILIPATPFFIALWIAHTEVAVEAARQEIDR